MGKTSYLIPQYWSLGEEKLVQEIEFGLYYYESILWCSTKANQEEFLTIITAHGHVNNETFEFVEMLKTLLQQLNITMGLGCVMIGNIFFIWIYIQWTRSEIKHYIVCCFRKELLHVCYIIDNNPYSPIWILKWFSKGVHASKEQRPSPLNVLGHS